MTLASARQALDDTIHSPVRLTLMSALNSVDQADYQTVKDALGVSYALLSKHVAILERAGYLKVAKYFVGRTAGTGLALTRAGREAYAAHLAALDEIVLGLRAPAEHGDDGSDASSARSPASPQRRPKIRASSEGPDARPAPASR